MNIVWSCLKDVFFFKARRCLRIIYNEKRSSFEDLLVEDGSISMHYNNVHTLSTEMYKVINGISPEVMKDVFKVKHETHYHLRHTLLSL